MTSLQDPYNYRLTPEGELYIDRLIQRAIWKQYISVDDRFNYRIEERSKKQFKNEFNTGFTAVHKMISVGEIYDMINKIVSDLIVFYELGDNYEILTLNDTYDVYNNIRSVKEKPVDIVKGSRTLKARSALFDDKCYC